MVDAKDFVKALRNEGAGLFTGVPDSLLSKLSAYLLNDSSIQHIIAANEGNAIGLAIGDYLATDRPAVVYMQNSGLGNVVNPLTSLACPDVYSIPMVLVIGWRGEPGKKDEPQHVMQGEITIGQLNILNIPYAIVDAETDIKETISKIWKKMLRLSGPVALLVRKGALIGDYSVPEEQGQYLLTREKALACLIDTLDADTFFVATTGKTGRELYELREHRHQSQHDFLTVGGMGHASSIALGVALHQKKRWTVCLDGDGASLMHMGAMATLNAYKPRRFIHVILNNFAHESVGGQPTVSKNVNYESLSMAFGYDQYFQTSTEEEIINTINKIKYKEGVFLLEIRLTMGSRKDLGRPKQSPIENKNSVQEFLEIECQTSN